MEEETTREVKSKGQTRTVDIEFKIPNNLPTYYATELAVQAVLTEFVLSFFEVKIPITTESVFDGDTGKGVIRADCVARIAISAAKIPDVIKVLQGRYDALIAEQEELIHEFNNEEQL
jgi:hypothetical protein